MNAKRLLLSIVVLLVFMFGYSWVVHGVLMKDLYARTQNLWRSEEAMGSHFHWLLAGQALMAAGLAVLFALTSGTGGTAAGIRLGFWIAMINLGLNFITYAVQPVPLRVIACWSAADVIMFTVGGALVGALYRPQSPAVPPAA
jgi:hypothetical protein